VEEIEDAVRRADASLATNLQLATPTEQLMPCWSRMLARISSAILAGGPSRLMAPETSRKASSRASGSTSGVTDRKTAMTSLDTAAYPAWRGAMNTACGHSRLARVTGIADPTPNALAS
jgi:hypothetical protein